MYLDDSCNRKKGVDKAFCTVWASILQRQENQPVCMAAAKAIRAHAISGLVYSVLNKMFDKALHIFICISKMNCFYKCFQ